MYQQLKPTGKVLSTALGMAFLLLVAGISSDQFSVNSVQSFVSSNKQTAASILHPATKITPAQAAALAVNDVHQTADGVQLRHRLHQADFSADGLHFKSRRGTLGWRWRLQSVGTANGALSGVAHGAVTPEIAASDSRTVQYDRGGVIEQYLARSNSIEQQFVIPAPLDLDSENLVIRGAVASEGRFEEIPTPGPSQEGNIPLDPPSKGEKRWRWVADDSKQFSVSSLQKRASSNQQPTAITLGDVTVFDANGEILPATMQVTATTTRIEVEGAALARAAYPVTIDPEIGANDFRVSDMGPDGSDSFNAVDAKVAYNRINNEYLVVWLGSDNLVAGSGDEIYGQRIDAATGAEVGSNDFRISDMGTDGDFSYAAHRPDVAYNIVSNEYLVVWDGDDNTGTLADDELEIFGQRIYGDRSLGDEVGNNDFRISDAGPDGDVQYRSFNARVAYNPAQNQYLVVWQGEDFANNAEEEILGQRIHGDRSLGDEVGSNDFRISDMGTDGDGAYGASRPHLAYNAANNEFLVVWSGDDDTGVLLDDEFEIYGQRLDAATGAEVGNNDFRISDMGSDGNVGFFALHPAVAWNNLANEYLVVWDGVFADGIIALGEKEIYGQRLFGDRGLGDEKGNNDFRISDMGPDGNADFDANSPEVVFNPTDNEYLVVWWGDDNTPPLVDRESEIFGQRIFGNLGLGDETGANDFRLSDMGDDSETDANTRANFDAEFAAVAFDSLDNEYLIVWSGNEGSPPQDEEELEIWAQRFAKSVRVTFGGLLSSSLGQALLGLDLNGHLVVSNIGASGLDGVSIAVDDGVGVAENAIEVLLDPLSLSGDVNPCWIVQGVGLIDGVSGVFGRVVFDAAGNNEFEVSADFSALGATGARVRVFRDGLLQGVADSPLGIVGITNPCFLVGDEMLVSRAAIVLEPLSVAGGVNPCMITGFAALIEFTDLGGTVFTGDEIRIEPLFPGGLPKAALRAGANIPLNPPSKGDFPIPPLRGARGVSRPSTFSQNSRLSNIPPNPPSKGGTLASAPLPQLQSLDAINILAGGIDQFIITDEGLRVPPSHSDFVALAHSNVKFDGTVLSDGSVHSNGDLTFHDKKKGTHTGNLSALGDITVEKGVTIVGNAIAGDEIYALGTITGVQLSHIPVAAMPLPTFSFSAGGPDFTVEKKTSQPLAFGTYGKVKVEKKATLRLSTGHYFLDALDTDNAATLIFDVTDGAVIVFTTKELDIDREVEIVITPHGENGSELVTFVSLQHNKIDIGKQASVLGTLIAPHAEVHFSHGSRFKGAAIADKVTVEEGVPFLHHHSPSALPKAGADIPLNPPSNGDLTEAIPTEFELAQNYPNPFNPSTVIRYQLPVSSKVDLSIYNLMGQVVRTLVHSEMPAGSHSVVWDATDDTGVRVASGVYLYVLRAGEFVSQRKLILMK